MRQQRNHHRALAPPHTSAVPCQPTLALPCDVPCPLATMHEAAAAALGQHTPEVVLLACLHAPPAEGAS
jgi:hypothetical protein